MVEGPAVTLGDDQAPAVRIDALEMFVDLLARVEEDGSSEEFYGRLCEAACALTSMERAVLFRYDETQRRGGAAGSRHNPRDCFARPAPPLEQHPARRLRRHAPHRRDRADRARGAAGGPRAGRRGEPRPRAARALPLAA